MLLTTKYFNFFTERLRVPSGSGQLSAEELFVLQLVRSGKIAFFILLSTRTVALKPFFVAILSVYFAKYEIDLN